MSAFILSLKGRDKPTALRKFFELLNVVQDKEGLRIADTERQVLVFFYSIKDISPRHRFSTVGKKEVREMSEKEGWTITSQNINNKLYSLIEKGYLIKDSEGEVTAKPWLESVISKLLYAIENNEEYDIKFRFGANDTQ